MSRKALFFATFFGCGFQRLLLTLRDDNDKSIIVKIDADSIMGSLWFVVNWPKIVTSYNVINNLVVRTESGL